VPAGVSGPGLKHLAACKRLAMIGWVDSRQPKFIGLPNLPTSAGVSDEVLAALAEVRMLHVLPEARGEEYTRPRNQEEVTDFRFTHSAVTGAGLKHLAGLPNLKLLVLSETKVTPADLRHLKGLTKLNEVHTPQTTDEVVAVLAEMGLLHAHPVCFPSPDGPYGNRPNNPREVHKLQLGGGTLTGKCLKHFDGFDNVTEIDLHDCPVADDDLKELPKRFPKLTKLSLIDHGATGKRTGLSDKGLEHVAELARLADLHVGGCREVTDWGLEHLAKLSRLEKLGVTGTAVTQDGARKLAAEMKHLKHLYYGPGNTLQDAVEDVRGRR
jgi:hypothetical protein